jgi:hypothetical protein
MDIVSVDERSPEADRPLPVPKIDDRVSALCPSTLSHEPFYIVQILQLSRSQHAADCDSDRLDYLRRRRTPLNELDSLEGRGIQRYRSMMITISSRCPPNPGTLAVATPFIAHPCLA